MQERKYRLYIDESGTHGYSESDEVKERYLCLLGVIISSESNTEHFSPKWEALRKMFTEDPDFPAIFHLSDVVEGTGLFRKLQDIKFQNEFNKDYLDTLKGSDYTICCVVLDKKKHLERYNSSAMHPYHYCLSVLLERYVNFLQENDGFGDVIAEVRGKKEDRLLKSEFEHFYNNGTFYLSEGVTQTRLSSKKLKLETKEARIAGLELSDMLATPMKFLTLYKYKRINKLSDNFTKVVLKTVYPRIRRAQYSNSVMKGFGIKLI